MTYKRKPRPFDTFFEKIDSPEKAWVLGWIISDGHVRKEPHRVITFHLHDKDIDVLDKIQSAIGTNYSYVKSKNHGVHLAICSTPMTFDLEKIGIPRGAKSLKVKPLKLKEDLMLHFWRGVWEGDGSVILKKSGPYKTASIVLTGNYFMCQGFKEYLNLPTDINYNGSKTTFRISKGSNNKKSWEEWYNKLYDSYAVENGLYLQRKFHSFNEVFSIL